MQRKRRQGNTTPQKSQNNRIGDLVESEGDEVLVVDLRRLMIRMFNKLKEEFIHDMQKQLSESQNNMEEELKNT
jgi:tRNA uridine 5-carbamoylmethylation protein Kti12